MLSLTLSLSLLILAVLSVFIYFFSQKVAYRFFYPAVVLFVLFGLVPIAYSVYVSFTNLKTGHLLEKSKVVDLFLSETMIKEEAPLLNYALFSVGDGYLMVVDNLSGTFHPGDQRVELGSMRSLPRGAIKLHPGETMEVIEGNTALQIVHPAWGTYHFFRSDLLAVVNPRYQREGEAITDQMSGEKLFDDELEGQFKKGTEAIGPGYFTFVGLKNYRDLFSDPDLKFVFLKSLGWTFLWAFLSVALTFSLGALLAVLLNDLQGRSQMIYRMIFIIPYSIPFFISVLIFKGMLNKDFGEINRLLSFFSISPVPWLEHRIWAKVSVLLVNLWLGFPYMFLIITGVLQSIPPSIYEASSLEGASRWQNFRFLTLPLILKATVPLLIGSFAFNLNNFVGIYLLTGGGPPIGGVSSPLGETDILISYTYRLAFEGTSGQNFGLAAAVSTFIFLLVLAFTWLNFKISKRWNLS